MDHEVDDDDDGSTVLIDSGDDLYDSDATEISDDEEHAQQNQLAEVQRAPSQQHADILQPGQPASSSHTEESQAGSESVLAIPVQSALNQERIGFHQAGTGLNQAATGSNQAATGLDLTGTGFNQIRAGMNPAETAFHQVATGFSQTGSGSNQAAAGLNPLRPATSASIPGPSGLNHANVSRTSQSGLIPGSSQGHAAPTSQSSARTIAHAAASSQSGARNMAHANEPRASSERLVNVIPAANHEQHVPIGQRQRLGDSSSQGSHEDTGSNNVQQGANRLPAANEMHDGLANQGAPVGQEEEPMHEEEEPMELEGVVVIEDESSNDSMSDFQEPKKSAVCGTGDDGSGSSDDESQSCIICYESWTTSGSHRLVSLRCGHLFGQSCIEQWLKGQGGKCPQCNTKAKKTDVRVIYAKALKVLDTSERDRAMKELEAEKELRKKAEMDAAQTQLRYVMAMEEVKRMKAMLDAHQKSATRNMFASAGSSGGQLSSSSQSAGHYMMERTIQVSPNGTCRVLAFDPTNQLLLASMQSSNNLFQGYGLKKISAMDFRTSQYIPIHSKPIRGLAFNGRHDGLVLSASVDKQLKITSLASNTVVQSYTCPMPAWCCTWNSTNTNYIYAGLQNGAIVIYDTRKADGVVETLTKEGSRCPIVSLKYVPSSTSVSFSCAGLLVGTLEGASFWEQLAAEEYRLHALQLEGSCTGVNFEPTTRHCVASFRPNKSHPATRHVMCEMKHQQVGDHGNSLVSTNTVQTFYGGTTMKLLTQSAIFPSPSEEGKLILSAGDEASSSVHTWDASTGCVRQKIAIGGTALDVCPFSMGETSYLAALTDRQIKLCKWVER